MKEVITVELDKADVEAAIEDLLNEQGYGVENIKFDINSFFVGSNDLVGATVRVIKKP